MVVREAEGVSAEEEATRLNNMGERLVHKVLPEKGGDQCNPLLRSRCRVGKNFLIS